jgi:putative (di)nucleoside polyphosphate hydrolase
MASEHPELSDEQISGYFRANVGILLVNSDGLVFAAERKEQPGAWQLPQGGIDQGEDEEQAARREMKEELGFVEEDLDKLLKPLGADTAWYAYQLPRDLWSKKRGRGQVQKFFAYRFIGQDEQLNEKFSASEEFNAWKWMSISALIEEVWTIRRPVYEAIARTFSEHLA